MLDLVTTTLLRPEVRIAASRSSAKIKEQAAGRSKQLPIDAR